MATKGKFQELVPYFATQDEVNGGHSPNCFFMDMDSVSPYIPTSEVLDPWEWFLGV